MLLGAIQMQNIRAVIIALIRPSETTIKPASTNLNFNIKIHSTKLMKSSNFRQENNFVIYWYFSLIYSESTKVLPHKFKLQR